MTYRLSALSRCRGCLVLCLLATACTKAPPPETGKGPAATEPGSPSARGEAAKLTNPHRLRNRGKVNVERDTREGYLDAAAYFKRLLELQPIACLLHFADPVLHDRRLHGVEPSPMNYWRTSRGPRVWRWVPDGDGG